MYVIIIYALGSAHEKFDSKPFQAVRTAEPFPIEAARFSTDSDAELSMYLIQGIRFQAHEKIGV